MESCQHYVVTKQSNLTHWHPVLGWFAQSMDCSLHEAMPLVKTQLYLLWSGPMVSLLLGQTLSELVENVAENGSDGPSSSGASGNILKRALDHRSNRTSATKHHRKLGSSECTKVALLCSLYQTALGTLTQLKLDILTGEVCVLHSSQSSGLIVYHTNPAHAYECRLSQ
jgi:ubiquitin-protein ligase E3 B